MVQKLDDNWIVANYLNYIREHKDDYLKFKELRKVINTKSITTYFQKIVSLDSLETFGYEALNRPFQSKIFSDTEMFYNFIGESRQVFAVENCIRGCTIERFASEINNTNEEEKILFMNIHPKVLSDPTIRNGETLRLLKKYNLQPEQIVLELTERESVFNYEQFKQTLEHYRNQGFRLAIDDAGTGYNSLKTIVYLKPEFIKIDKFLIKNIEQNEEQQQMVDLLLYYADVTNTKVIAEGIETKAELEYLQEIGVDYGQGYLIGRPQVNLL